MTAPTSNRFDSVASAGASTGGAGLVPMVTIRSPSSSDVRGPFGYFKPGQEWVNTVANSVYFLTSLTASAGIISAVWTVSGATSTLATLTADSGGALTPSSGNISILGTTNQVTSTGSGSTITLSTPATFVAPGSITAASGNITATNGNIVLTAAGNKQVYTSVASTTTAGANSAGTVALVGGTATVSTTAITASSLVRLTVQGLGTVTVPSAVCCSAKSAGVSFTILASQATDTSTVFWEVVN